MLVTAPDPSPTTLAVRPWPDPVLDDLGHDPRSAYVERFWLGLLGPSSVLLLRRLAGELEAAPAGFVLDVEHTARRLGLGTRGGRNSPMARTLLRCCQFHMLHLDGTAGELLARRKLPPLTRPQLARLSEDMQREHADWDTGRDRRHELDHVRRRARRLALSLLELGESAEEAERQLHQWHFHPAVTRDATSWASAEHVARNPTPP